MKIDDIEVSVEPHTALQSTRIGVLEVDLGQYKIFANGIHVGYISKKPGFGAKLIHQTLPSGAKEVIERKVDILLGRSSPPAATIKVFEEEPDDTEEEF